MTMRGGIFLASLLERIIHWTEAFNYWLLLYLQCPAQSLAYSQVLNQQIFAN